MDYMEFTYVIHSAVLKEGQTRTLLDQAVTSALAVKEENARQKILTSSVVPLANWEENSSLLKFIYLLKPDDPKYLLYLVWIQGVLAQKTMEIEVRSIPFSSLLHCP